MTIFYIDASKGSNGAGTFADPYNTIPAAADNNSYLFREGIECVLSQDWIAGRTDVILGTYDASTGNQIIHLSRKAAVTRTSVGGGTVHTIGVAGTVRVKIQSIDITNKNSGATNRMGIYSSSTTVDLQVTDCIIHGIRGVTGTHNGIQLVGSSNTRPYIARNIIYNIGEDGLHFQASTGLIVEENWVYAVSLDNALGDCLQLSAAVPDYIVRRNILDRRGGQPGKQCFIASGMTSTGGVLDDNDLYADSFPTSGVIYIEQANAIVRRNFCSGGSYGAELQGNNTLFEGNIVRSGEFSPPNYYGTRITSGTGISIRGNTYVGRSMPDASSIGIYQPGGQAASAAANNIIMGFGTGITKVTMTETNGCFWNNLANGLTPTNGVLEDPQLNASSIPGNVALRTAGVFLGGSDFFSKAFKSPPTIGAAQYQGAARAVADRIVRRRTSVVG